MASIKPCSFLRGNSSHVIGQAQVTGSLKGVDVPSFLATQGFVRFAAGRCAVPNQKKHHPLNGCSEFVAKGNSSQQESQANIQVFRKE